MPTIKYKNKFGKTLPGITTLVSNNVGWGKGGLLYWANQRGIAGIPLDEARKEATIPGTIVHYLVECDLKEIKPNLDQYKKEDIEKANTAFANYLFWKSKFNFIPRYIEPHLISEVWQFGGTPDVIGFIDGHLGLIDWKSGKIYESTFLQLAGYKELWKENHPNEPLEGGLHVLRISKNEEIPSFHFSFWKRLPKEAWKAVKCSIELNEYQKLLKKLL